MVMVRRHFNPNVYNYSMKRSALTGRCYTTTTNYYNILLLHGSSTLASEAEVTGTIPGSSGKNLSRFVWITLTLVIKNGDF